MKIQYLFLVFSLSLLLFIFSCQTAKKTEDVEESHTEKLAQLLQQQKQDSLQRAFCKCLVDSTSRDETIKNIDNFIAQNVDINIPCSLKEEVVSGALERLFVNMGVAVSNRLLRTKFKKRGKKTTTILKEYPIVMLFSEDTIMIRQLVNRGANLDTKTKDVGSILENYVSQNELENIKFVLSLGAKTENLIIQTNDEKTLDFLIENGAKTENIDKVSLFEEENYKQLAEKYKIDISKITCEEFTQLSKITQFQKINFERTKWLLENNVDASCMDGIFLEKIIDENFDGRVYSNRTKKKANQHTRKEWIELVAKYNVNWNQCGSFGKNPLILVVEKHNTELLKTLLNQKANPNFACSFAGQQKTAKYAIEKEINYAENNEKRKKEREKEKYSKKDAEKHAIYLKKLQEIKELLDR
ncbi:hypothetical protein ACE193_02160 [Bernardetia sp. OM2101]|uniref:hypothetical protein n=1 Tax=Bernardetia sp. OM2101 TaxID=3344876 RepID=UPI0035CF29F3